MLSKKITYTDYDGVQRTETFYFNLSRAELTELQLTYPGGYAEHIERVTDSQDRPAIIALFKDLIKRTYGEKSEDGRRLVKSPELSEAFMQTPAYDELFMEIASNSDFATEFVANVMPDFGEPDKKAQLIAQTKARIEGKKNLAESNEG